MESNVDNWAEARPQEINFLQSPAHRLVIDRLPSVSFFCQKVNLPGIGVQDMKFLNSAGRLPMPVAGSPEIGNFDISMIVDENLMNWREVYNWIHSITTFEDGSRYKPMSEHYSDATLFIMNSAMKPKFRVNIKGMFPKSLSGLDFDTRVSTIEPIEASIEFSYISYELIVI